MTDRTKLVLGSGKRPKAGWFNIDIAEACKPDLVWNLIDTPWPIATDTVEAIYSSDFLEHLGFDRSGDWFIRVMNECWRVMKTGGEAFHRCPLGTGEPAMRDPTHRRFIVPGTFQYFDPKYEVHRFNGTDYGIKPWTLTSLGIVRGYVEAKMTPIK